MPRQQQSKISQILGFFRSASLETAQIALDLAKDAVRERVAKSTEAKARAQKGPRKAKAAPAPAATSPTPATATTPAKPKGARKKAKAAKPRQRKAAPAAEDPATQAADAGDGGEYLDPGVDEGAAQDDLELVGTGAEN